MLGFEGRECVGGGVGVVGAPTIVGVSFSFGIV